MGVAIGGGMPAVTQVPPGKGGGPVTQVAGAKGGGPTVDDAAGATTPASTVLSGGPGGAVDGAAALNPQLIAALTKLVDVLRQLITVLQAQVGGGGPTQKSPTSGGGPVGPPVALAPAPAAAPVPVITPTPAPVVVKPQVAATTAPAVAHTDPSAK